MEAVELKGLLPEELQALVEGMGQKPYRARQLQAWLYARGVDDLATMTDLSKEFRAELGHRARITRLDLLAQRQSASGEAVKFLFGLPQGGRVESVLIVDGDRRTACLSSQVGCPLDCRFCATGRMGFVRNLRAAEIIDQVLQVGRYVRGRGERVTNVVMMGMGEPLLNYDEVVRAIRVLRLELGPGIGGRRITVSTAGYVPGIRRLAGEGLNAKLAISLNATTDAARQRLMPIGRRFRLAELLDAAREFCARVGPAVTFEYVLMDGVNDSVADAKRLAELTRPIPCKINLIPYNELGADSPFRRPAASQLERFRALLEARSPRPVTVRESRGRDIDAACGQLYQETEDGGRRRDEAAWTDQ
ncbi:MAG: 23S rRNA (adenine(2503)-C(2))-methyltransferase RlmN [Candidatus Latescibacterota bacterium]